MDAEAISETMNDFPEPKVDMLFESSESFLEYYKKYGKVKGFPVFQRSSKIGKDGEIRWITLACQRNGKSRSNSQNPMVPNLVMKTECKARLNGVVEKGETVKGKIRLTSFILEHNHPLSPGKARYFRCNRFIHPCVKRQLELNDRTGISVCKNFNTLVVEAGGHEHLPFIEKDCRNYIEDARRLRLGVGDAKAISKYFTDMRRLDSNFWYEMDLDDDGRLKNIFWIDGRSRTAYEQFGDVVTFDTTYLTNKYDMPFAPFVGVNHHGQSILLGCGLISNENIETFIWLFKNWLASVNYCVPKAIITDQDRAMQNAIEAVFPQTRHRWCLWHIMKKLPEKLRSHPKYEHIKSDIQSSVYDSKTKEDFEFGGKVSSIDMTFKTING